mmetsp:Transcript_53193/g.95002  ORF Transcript_53193/g.95002 Transcript_53193/m.95002 type:complete len:313 (+) Transcript_53193:159-1097(+)
MHPSCSSPWPHWLTASCLHHQLRQGSPPPIPIMACHQSRPLVCAYTSRSIRSSILRDAPYVVHAPRPTPTCPTTPASIRSSPSIKYNLCLPAQGQLCRTKFGIKGGGALFRPLSRIPLKVHVYASPDRSLYLGPQTPFWTVVYLPPVRCPRSVHDSELPLAPGHRWASFRRARSSSTFSPARRCSTSSFCCRPSNSSSRASFCASSAASSSLRLPTRMTVCSSCSSTLGAAVDGGAEVEPDLVSACGASAEPPLWALRAAISLSMEDMVDRMRASWADCFLTSSVRAAWHIRGSSVAELLFRASIWACNRRL